jgi:DNA-binding SARP family transcriptional activator/tetratricopeptide (TPR) repeat protein
MGRGVRIELLGGLRVDGTEPPWPSRRAAELVALLALAERHRLSRDQAIEALWPTLAPEAGAANLRKAAHHARQALRTPEAVVLRGGQVALFPELALTTDVADPDAAGELLPEFPYEDWVQAPREHLRARRLERLRAAGAWERVAELEPTDEAAHRELMRAALAAGRRPEAIRWYGRLRGALRRELGLRPAAETEELYDACVEGLRGDEPPFVGRQVELARATARLRDRSAAVLAVRGPGGIGKTAFCRELADVARADGWTTVMVVAGGDGPYGPVVTVAEQLLAADPSLAERLGPRSRAVLAALTPLAGTGPPLDPPLTRHDVIGAVRALLLAAGHGTPVVALVDDVHLADEATIELLIHLGGGAAQRVLTVLAYRAEPERAPLARGVARLVRAGRADEIDLEPLGHDDAAALVAAAAAAPREADVVERIVALAQGNPFLTLEAARSAVAGVPALLPRARNAIASRFLDLDAPTLGVLERLALVGQAIEPAEAVALGGEHEEEVLDALDRALDAGVLVVDGPRYRFRHELVRQALVDELPPHRRRALHRETAGRLVGQDADPGAIARHWLAGDRRREAQPFLLAAAARASSLGAFRDALTHLDALLLDEPVHAEALVLRAEALDVLGDGGAPAAYAAAAAAAGEPRSHELRAKQALAMIKLGDPPGGLAVLDGVDPQTVDGKLAHALALCGAAALGFIGPELGAAKAAEARRLALRSDDPAALTIASWANAAAAHARGDLRATVRADLHDTRGLPQLAMSIFDGQLCITQRFLYGARPYDDVIAFADNLAAEAERLDAARGRAFAVTIRGEARLLSGRVEEADEDLCAGAELHRQIAAPTGHAFALQRRAEVALHRGDRDQANALLDEALALARESGVGFHLLDRIYGARIAAAADPGAALAVLEEAEEAVRGPAETCPGCRITLAVPAAIAAARAGDLARADAWLAESEYLAGVVMKLPAWDAALAEARAHRALAAGESSTASAQFAHAAAGFAAAGHPIDAARCRAQAAVRGADQANA